MVARLDQVNTLRKIIGFGKLKSTLFDVENEADVVKFTGRGFGHGSGLCQWGAKYLADHGVGYLSILKHYYPLAQISSGEAFLPHVTNR